MSSLEITYTSTDLPFFDSYILNTREQQIYSKIRTTFDNIAFNSIESISDDYDRTFKSLDDIHENGYHWGARHISNQIQIAIDILNNLGIYDIDTRYFVSTFYDGYGNWEDSFYEVSEVYENLEAKIQSEANRRNQRKANRTHLAGAGSSLSAYMSASAKAGAVNMLTGGLHGMFNAIANSNTRSQVKEKKEAIFQSPALKNLIVDSVITSIQLIQFALLDAINSSSLPDFDPNNIRGLSSDDAEKSDRLLKSLKDNKVKPEHVTRVITDAINANPYNANIYIFALSKFGDPDKDIENTAIAFGLHTVVTRKHEALSDFIKKLSLSTLKDAIEKSPEIIESSELLGLSDSDVISKLKRLAKVGNHRFEFDGIDYPSADAEQTARQDANEINEIFLKLMNLPYPPEQNSTEVFEEWLELATNADINNTTSKTIKQPLPFSFQHTKQTIQKISTSSPDIDSIIDNLECALSEMTNKGYTSEHAELVIKSTALTLDAIKKNALTAGGHTYDNSEHARYTREEIRLYTNFINSIDSAVSQDEVDRIVEDFNKTHTRYSELNYFRSPDAEFKFKYGVSKGHAKKEQIEKALRTFNGYTFSTIEEMENGVKEQHSIEAITTTNSNVGKMRDAVVLLQNLSVSTDYAKNILDKRITFLNNEIERLSVDERTYKGKIYDTIALAQFERERDEDILKIKELYKSNLDIRNKRSQLEKIVTKHPEAMEFRLYFIKQLDKNMSETISQEEYDKIIQWKASRPRIDTLELATEQYEYMRDYQKNHSHGSLFNEKLLQEINLSEIYALEMRDKFIAKQSGETRARPLEYTNNQISHNNVTTTPDDVNSAVAGKKLHSIKTGGENRLPISTAYFLLAFIAPFPFAFKFVLSNKYDATRTNLLRAVIFMYAALVAFATLLPKPNDGNDLSPQNSTTPPSQPSASNAPTYNDTVQAEPAVPAVAPEMSAPAPESSAPAPEELAPAPENSAPAPQ